jgi:glycosyltransferase involved in cell wall biosynthesis
MTSLSVLVPVYNEQHLVAASLERLLVLERSPGLSRIQVVVVDDCSRDRTAEVLAAFERRMAARPEATGPRIEWRFLRHERNGGKGRAIQTALREASCAVTVIHDADLEYHPRDLLRIVQVFEEEGADAVFGSRFAGGPVRRALLYRHELGNRLLTFLTNVVTNVNLTDMETCYKAVRTDLLKSIPIVSDDFRLEPELTIKLAKREARIFEVPISYSGRTYQEGKKISWRDGLKALGAIVRFSWSDRIYHDDEYGSQILARMAHAPRYNAWMADLIRPFCGRTVLEIGSGTGNLTRQLIPRDQYVASDINPLYLASLRGLTADRPYLDVALTDITRGESFPRVEGGFQTAICLNVVEHVDDDVGALRNIRAALATDGRAVVLVPQGPEVFGTLDEVLGHKRRYTKASLHALAAAAGFRVKELLELNRLGRVAWWLNGMVLKRRHFGRFQIWALNALVPFLRRFDRALPFDALSLIAVLEPLDVNLGAPVHASEANPSAGERIP